MSATPLPLRHRVALAFTALGFLLSLLFSIAAVMVTEDYERVLATEILQGQAEDYSLRLSNHLAAQLPQTHRLSGYHIDAAGMPPEYAALPLGMHEDEHSDGTHVGVFDTSAGRLVFVVDLSDIETLEAHLKWFLASMIVLGTALAGWLGWLFAGASLRPVRQLAADVDALPAQPQRTRLTERTGNDELGRLAHAIDAYQERLADADMREQAFFADASHELRTPLTVVQGVTEVLLDDAGSDPVHAARLQRLDRGVRDMGNLLEALLGVARRTELQAEMVDARSFLQEAAGIAAAGRTGAGLVIDAQGALRLPRREALLLVSGLLRKLHQQPPDAAIRIQLRDQELLIEKAVPTDAGGTDATNARSDTGRGAAMLDRLAQRLGWSVTFETSTRIRIRTRA